MGDGKGFEGFKSVFQSFSEAFGEAAKRPLIGVTQGGSSRKGGGAKPAANAGMNRGMNNGTKKERK